MADAYSRSSLSPILLAKLTEEAGGEKLAASAAARFELPIISFSFSVFDGVGTFAFSTSAFLAALLQHQH